jgi:enoyl-[acyl-carrier-protein] reductase (NADH)
VGTSEDMAQMASFLLSEKSSWISGQIFHVDGGMSTLLVNRITITKINCNVKNQSENLYF